MSSVRLGEDLGGLDDELIEKCCSIAMKAHKYPEKPYVSKKMSNSNQVVFGFPGSWSVNDWFKNSPFGETEVDVQLFPSLKYIGLDEIAKVNEAFLQRFKSVLANPQFKTEIGKVVTDGKQAVFVGHSSGGPIAVLAAIWFLEEHIRPDPYKVKPLCLTFGSPLVGDRFVNHALRRENWSCYFIHFVMKYDIVPRISLTPYSAISHQLPQILNYFNLKSPGYMSEAQSFYETVMKSAASVTSHAACKMMGNTNLLLETILNFVDLSPYKPFGTYVFCTGNGKLVVVRNPDAVLQLLFYSSKSSSEQEVIAVAQRSLSDHLHYKSELEQSLGMQSVTSLHDDHLISVPLSSDDTDVQNSTTNTALNDLGLCPRGRLCLRAAGVLEKQKKNNQEMIEKKMEDIEGGIRTLETYKRKCVFSNLGYYDAFKISKYEEDFHANVTRLELAGIWDEIMEMLKRSELPDEFEGRKEWIGLGTRYRRLVEPLDIANYHRHLKNEDTGPYMTKGRPKRYKCTQRWHEHASRLPPNESLESCFWAEVEELCINVGSPSTKENVLRLHGKVQQWISSGCLDNDVLLEGSTFMKLWNKNST